MHPDHLLDQLTAKQIKEWEAYDRLDPIGSWREDFRMAKTLATIQNIAISMYSKKGSNPKYVMPLDEMPKYYIDEDEEQQPKQSWEEMKEILLGIARVQNKKVEAENVMVRTRKPKNVNSKE